MRNNNNNEIRMQISISSANPHLVFIYIYFIHIYIYISIFICIRCVLSCLEWFSIQSTGISTATFWAYISAESEKWIERERELVACMQIFCCFHLVEGFANWGRHSLISTRWIVVRRFNMLSKREMVLSIVTRSDQLATQFGGSMMDFNSRMLKNSSSRFYQERHERGHLNKFLNQISKI